jgi:hypothetical protein
MKVCSKCKNGKELNNFQFDSKRNRHLSWCISCNRLHGEKIKNLIIEWKNQGCIKCGDKRHYIIDAHHLDPSNKNFTLGLRNFGVERNKKELEKCIPLCSNCHREFHHLEKQNNITIQNYLENGRN